MSTKLLKDLNFAERINRCEAITEAGKELTNKYKAYVYSNPATCGLVNGFIAESSKYGFDNGLMTTVESLKDFINENNISWKLASACESVNNNNSIYNYINKLGEFNILVFEFVDTFNNAKQALCSAWDKANEIGIAVGDFCVQAAVDIGDACVEAANEICKFVIKSGDSLVSIIHGLSVEAGFGMGVGGEFEIGLASFGATFRHDYLNINGNVIDGLDICNVTEYSMGASVGVGDLSYGMNMTATHSHSYFDKNCTCKNKLNHSYSCPVDNYSFSTEKSISFGLSGYIGIGGTLQITYYSDQVANELYNIWK